MSPAAARTLLTRAVIGASSDSGRWPPQVGRQPPQVGAMIADRVKVFWPVLAMTVANSGGLSIAITYGAAPNQLSVRPSLLSTWVPSTVLGAVAFGRGEFFVLATTA